MANDAHRPPAVVALGTVPRRDTLDYARRAERDLAHHGDAVLTETFDSADGTSHVRHAGEHPQLHGLLLTERAHGQRHRVSEEQRSRRVLAALACLLILGSATLLAFAPESTNVYLGTAVLLAAAGAFGIKAFRIRLRGLEIDAGKS